MLKSIDVYVDHVRSVVLQLKNGESKSVIGVKQLTHLFLALQHEQLRRLRSYVQLVRYMARPMMDAMDSIDGAMRLVALTLHHPRQKVFLQRYLQLQSIAHQL